MGGCFGFSLSGELCEPLWTQAADAGALTDARALLGVLLLAVGPAFLYIFIMVLCACERRALPLWGLALLLCGARSGMAAGILKLADLLALLPVYLPISMAQGALAVLSLDCRRDGNRNDVYQAAERLLIPSTVYLILASLAQLLLTSWTQRLLPR